MENKDCAGHRILIKTRREKAREYAAKEQCKTNVQGSQETTNSELDKKKRWELVIQSEKSSGLREEQCCQPDEGNKMIAEHDVKPTATSQPSISRTNNSIVNSTEHRDELGVKTFQCEDS